MTKFEIDTYDVLKSWNNLHAVLSKLTEKEVKKLLGTEKKGLKRKSILTRLHQRYTSLKVSRERTELLKNANEG